MKKIIYILFFMLIPSIALGASSRVMPTSYNEKTYGDSTISGTADPRHYSSLAAWEAATDNDLVTATDGEVLTCYDDDAPYYDAISMVGATTNSSYFRVVQAANGHRGTKTSGVRFENIDQTKNKNVLLAQEQYSSFYDLGVKCTSDGAFNAQGVMCSAGAGFNSVVGCTVYDINGGAQGIGFLFSSNSTVPFYLIDSFADNCVGVSARSGGVVLTANIAGATTTLYVYNCTITNNKYGIIGATITAPTCAVIANSKNCIVYNSVTSDYYFSGVGAETHNQTTNLTTNPSFTSDGYHLNGSVRDNGTNLSADGAFAFNDDIDGGTRPYNSIWDIGADEYTPPPVANFSADETTMIVGATVTFTDSSTQTPLFWSWTFTGGTPSTSTDENPVIDYDTVGVYDVSLTATNGGGSDGETKIDYITVNPQPPSIAGVSSYGVSF